MSNVNLGSLTLCNNLSTHSQISHRLEPFARLLESLKLGPTSAAHKQPCTTLPSWGSTAAAQQQAAQHCIAPSLHLTEIDVCPAREGVRSYGSPICVGGHNARDHPGRVLPPVEKSILCTLLSHPHSGTSESMATHDRHLCSRSLHLPILSRLCCWFATASIITITTNSQTCIMPALSSANVYSSRRSQTFPNASSLHAVCPP